MNKELLKSKCRNLLKEYEEILLYLIEEEERKINESRKLGNTEFEIIKDSIYNVGIREGMRKILARINHHANE